MIKRIPLKVEYVDGTVERALCTGVDSITFERTYDLGTDQVGKRLEYVWFLAWAALTRTGEGHSHVRGVAPDRGGCRRRRGKRRADRTPPFGEGSTHFALVHLSYEFGLAPSVILAESDRMQVTMLRYLRWRHTQHGDGRRRSK